MSDHEETDAEALARHRAADAADYATLVAEAATHPPTSECPFDECSVCGFRDCPAQSDAHYYHDGCPECHGPKTPRVALDVAIDAIWGTT